MKELHIVPLSKQSVAILKEIQKITGDSYGGFLFPSQQNPRKIMSENTFLRVLEILGYKEKATAHGFRSTASTILNENGFRSDVIERQLAHGERDQVRAAYNYAQYLPERKEMMNWWANYIDSVAIHNKRRVSKLKQVAD
jgi:integrase